MTGQAPLRMAPGSAEALAAGCACSPSENHQGRGNYRDGRSFSVKLSCPMHGRALHGQMSLFGPVSSARESGGSSEAAK